MVNLRGFHEDIEDSRCALSSRPVHRILPQGAASRSLGDNSDGTGVMVRVARDDAGSENHRKSLLVSLLLPILNMCENLDLAACQESGQFTRL